MPELPEVETSRIHVEKFCRRSEIVKCIAIEQGGGPRDGQFDDIVIGEDLTAQRLRETLEGRTVLELKRRGKQLWFVLDRPPHPLFHFGMTGAFTVKGERRHKFVKFKVSEEWPPKFTKLELQVRSSRIPPGPPVPHLSILPSGDSLQRLVSEAPRKQAPMSNGTCLALTDPRRLARVRLREEPESQPPISVLGPDPLTHPLPLETFAQALARIAAPIKAALLDQYRVVSGVGNWIADEVCFQACVHPASACNTLAPEQVTALHTKLLSICREASELRADYTTFPPDWLFHHRWGKGKTSDGAPHVSSGQLIKFDVVGGRTTAFVPEIQRKGLLSPEQRKANQREQKKDGVKAETPKTESKSKSARRRKGGKRSIPKAGFEEENGRSEAEARSEKTEIEDGTCGQNGGEVKESRTRARVTAKSQRRTRGTRPPSEADVKEETQEEDTPVRSRDAEVVEMKKEVPRKRKVSPSSPRARESEVDIAAFSAKAKLKRSTREVKVAPNTESEASSAVERAEGNPAVPRSPNNPASKRPRSGATKGVGTRRSARLSNLQAS